MARTDIAVTGMGLITSVGTGVDANVAAMRDGASGAAPIAHFPTGGMNTRFAARVPDPTLSTVSHRERALQMAERVTADALNQAALGPDDLAQRRATLYGAFAHPEPDLWHRAPPHDDALVDRIRHGYTAADVGRHLSERWHLSGLPVNVSTACASSASAIQLAAEALRRGRIDVAVVVAADSSIHPEGMIRFSLLSALSTRNDDPARASRPFSRSRDGFVMGEGAAALILERSDDARARGAAILGHVAGCGDATDNFHRTRSHPSGRVIVDCLRAALADAGVDAAEIDYINAHGTSTPENDKMEAMGIREVFGTGDDRPLVSSTKSMVGHTLVAAGAVEAVSTLAAMRAGIVPPNVNAVDVDEELGLAVVSEPGLERDVRLAVSNSFGFGGQNVSLVLAAAG